eukprot:TRINITY_DN5089_c0_g1_i1.p1 TRINITY_DN5089_c0_g1~~TRINITY_DN5089_c0_g1_i1.p1  ORF type:complete len:149 (-),score=59.47 TRINITY_DN5089_c0_g1_i1:218-640(-)
MFLFKKETKEEKEIKEKQKNKKVLQEERKKREKLQKSKQSYSSFVQAYQVGAHEIETPMSTVVVTSSGLAKERALIVADDLDELPQQVKESLARMKVLESDLRENMPTLMNILGFTDKYKPKRAFKTREQQKNHRNSSRA